MGRRQCPRGILRTAAGGRAGDKFARRHVAGDIEAGHRGRTAIGHHLHAAGSANGAVRMQRHLEAVVERIDSPAGERQHQVRRDRRQMRANVLRHAMQRAQHRALQQGFRHRAGLVRPGR